MEDEMEEVIRGELMALAADVERSAGLCGACQATESRRRYCKACFYVKYCNGACQRAGWGEHRHKEACRVLAADRAIAEGAASFALNPADLPPLSDILAGLNDGAHAGAYEATARLSLLLGRNDGPAYTGGGDALWDGIVASNGVPSLVASLAAGGLRACRAAGALRACLERSAAPRAQIMVDAAALPPLVRAISLPSLHADLSDFWGLRAAADAASELLGAGWGPLRTRPPQPPPRPPPRR